MAVWNDHLLFFDARDARHVEVALDMVGRVHVDYVPAVTPDVYLRFVSAGDALIFKSDHPASIININNTGILENVASLSSISRTLRRLSDETQVAHVLEAALWCRDDATEKAFNAALSVLSGRFAGPLPTI